MTIERIQKDHKGQEKSRRVVFPGHEERLSPGPILANLEELFSSAEEVFLRVDTDDQVTVTTYDVQISAYEDTIKKKKGEIILKEDDITDHHLVKRGFLNGGVEFRWRPVNQHEGMAKVLNAMDAMLNT